MPALLFLHYMDMPWNNDEKQWRWNEEQLHIQQFNILKFGQQHNFVSVTNSCLATLTLVFNFPFFPPNTSCLKFFPGPRTSLNYLGSPASPFIWVDQLAWLWEITLPSKVILSVPPRVGLDQNTRNWKSEMSWETTVLGDVEIIQSLCREKSKRCFRGQKVLLF